MSHSTIEQSIQAPQTAPGAGTPPSNRSTARTGRDSNRRSMRAAAAVALVIGSLTLAACGSPAEEPASPSAGHGDHAESTPSASSTTAPAETTAHNDADVMFAAMMIPHHQQAVEMSETVLAAEDLPPEVRDLAERIRAAQAPEIETMESWLERWGADAADHGGHRMEGMLTEEELQELEGADGARAAELFLTGMIEHHRGAVEMAEDELRSGENAEALALAEQVIADQTAEIEEMEGLLAEVKQ
ncbi:DUF305 domain-containing protein [Zhihengliuella sp.]|uniref:DUF305 domain-containing protein n=1 Tax=Zhihengliuella sp. TaxID=1954483 RepID=UPI002811F298|nr:DUF305 domain-containing protein [Zhihengliuella sp.]